MTYEDMLEQINNIPMFGEAGGLDNLKQYLAALDHPERDLPVIHVAGTNGKGSVSAFMESILREAGYKTALFTSPHLLRINERFRINFQECEDELLIRAWERVKTIIDEREERNLKMLTYFEIMFLMGMLVFQWEKPDYCIIETGLGGRLDATVLTNPILCVITSISLDHTALLGDTIPEIAAEKAGIIKEGVPVVFFDEKNGAAPVIIQEAEEKKSELLRVSYRDVTFLKNVRNVIDFSLENRYYKLNYVSVNSGGHYQMANAAMALTAIHRILPNLSEDVMRAGIQHMRWPGRMEEIAQNIYVDGAHNPGAIQQICQMMRLKMTNPYRAEDEDPDEKHEKGESEMQEESWSLLFAVCADKDYENMVTELSELPWKSIYVTKIKPARGAGVERVAEIFRQHSKAPIHIYQTSEEAYDDAAMHLQADESLLCLGSLYLVGELKEHVSIV